MKLRNFKKAVRMAGRYRCRTPRILACIYGTDDTRFVYYTCHRLKARMRLETGRFEGVSISVREKGMKR